MREAALSLRVALLLSANVVSQATHLGCSTSHFSAVSVNGRLADLGISHPARTLYRNSHR